MSSINRLGSVATFGPGDSLAAYSASLGNDAAIPLQALVDYLQAALSLGGSGYVTQYAAPNVSGFSVTMVSPSAAQPNVQLIITAPTYLAAGAVVLPADPTDGEIVLISSINAVNSISFSGDKTIYGAPTTLSAGGFFSAKYDAITGAWLAVSATSGGVTPNDLAVAVSPINTVSAAWVASSDGAITAVAQVMRGLTDRPRLGDPALFEPYDTGVYKYFNPGASTSTGTLGAPFGTFAQAIAAWQKGITILQFAGTRAVATGYMLPGATGTDGGANACAWGVCDPTTGLRIKHRTGLATVDFQNNTSPGYIVALSNLNFVSIDSIAIVNVANAGAGALAIGGSTGTNCRVIDCTFSGNIGICDIQMTFAGVSNALTASIASTVLTVTAAATATLDVGQSVTGAGVPANTMIVAKATGTGGVGTYTLNNGATVASESMTAVNGATNHVVQGNSFLTTAALGSIYYSLSANDPTLNLNYNRGTGTGATLTVVDASDNTVGRYVAGNIGCNVFEDSNTEGVRVICAGVIPGRKLNFARVTSRRNLNGLKLQGALVVGGVSVTGDFTGAIVDDCDLHNNEFGLYLQSVKGVLAQFFRACGNGSKTGLAPVTSNKYGRAFEIVGTATAPSVGNTIVCPYLTGSYNWINSGGATGTDGVGAGFDDYSYGNLVQGGFIAYNEGNGVQFNLGFGNRIVGAVVANNFIPPASRGIPLSFQGSEIFLVSSPYCEVSNCTIVNDGGAYQRIGVLEVGGCPGLSSFNHLIVGPTQAASARNTNSAGSVEHHNTYVGSGALVIASETGTPVTAGAGTEYGTAADYDATSPFYKATEGFGCDGTGAEPSPGAVSLTGASLASRTPRGALHATY